jgi:putative oxidoreductase
MRERAKTFGVRLEVWSQEGAGTEVDLTISASIAYRLSSAPFNPGRSEPAPLMLAGAAIAGGGFVLFGLWTPFAAAIEVFLELCSVFSQTAHQENSILLAALAASLVMLGPGAWSIDARLFGRRRIDILSLIRIISTTSMHFFPYSVPGQ